MRLRLREEVHRARRRPAERRNVDPREVVVRDHEAARPRHAILAVDTQPRHERASAPPMTGLPIAHAASTRFTRRALADERFDPPDDVLHVHARRVDLLRVPGRLHPLGVLLVAHADVRGERVCADPRPVRHAASRTLVAVGDEIDLHLGLRCDDGADVAALDHDVAVAAELALPLPHHLAHGRVPRDDGNHSIDALLANRRRDVLARRSRPDLRDRTSRAPPARARRARRPHRGRARDTSRATSAARYIAPVSR